jgi:hypothetical protein
VVEYEASVFLSFNDITKKARQSCRSAGPLYPDLWLAGPELDDRYDNRCGCQNHHPLSVFIFVQMNHLLAPRSVTARAG